MSPPKIGATVTWLRNNKPSTGTVTLVEKFSCTVIVDTEPDRGEEWSIPNYRILKVDNWMDDLCQV